MALCLCQWPYLGPWTLWWKDLPYSIGVDLQTPPHSQDGKRWARKQDPVVKYLRGSADETGSKIPWSNTFGGLQIWVTSSRKSPLSLRTLSSSGQDLSQLELTWGFWIFFWKTSLCLATRTHSISVSHYFSFQSTSWMWSLLPGTPFLSPAFPHWASIPVPYQPISHTEAPWSKNTCQVTPFPCLQNTHFLIR